MPQIISNSNSDLDSFAYSNLSLLSYYHIIQRANKIYDNNICLGK